MVKIHLPSRRHGFYCWVGKIPLEKEMATHCSILAWEIPYTEEFGGLQSRGWKRGQKGRKGARKNVLYVNNKMRNEKSKQRAKVSKRKELSDGDSWNSAGR